MFLTPILLVACPAVSQAAPLPHSPRSGLLIVQLLRPANLPFSLLLSRQVHPPILLRSHPINLSMFQHISLVNNPLSVPVCSPLISRRVCLLILLLSLQIIRRTAHLPNRHNLVLIPPVNRQDFPAVNQLLIRLRRPNPLL